MFNHLDDEEFSTMLENNKQTRALYKLDYDYGRLGIISGLFVAYEHEIARLFATTIYFGEILGKHSDIILDLKPEDITVVSTNQLVIEELLKVADDSGTICGYNPFDFLN